MIADIDRRVLTRLTPPDRTAMEPVWSPDGRQVAHSQVVSGVENLFLATSDGSFQMDRLTTSPDLQLADSFSPDGRWLVFTEMLPQTGADLFLLTLADRSVRRGVTRTPARFEGRGQSVTPSRSAASPLHASRDATSASRAQFSRPEPRASSRRAAKPRAYGFAACCVSAAFHSPTGSGAPPRPSNTICRVR